MIRRFLFIFFSCFYAITSVRAADADTVVIRDLSHDWYFYHSDAKGYLPLVNKGKFNKRAFHFDVPLDDYANNLLKITSLQPVSIFINNRIVDIVAGNVYYSLDSIREQFAKGPIHFTVYSRDLNPFGISTEIITVDLTRGQPLADKSIVINRRVSNSFDDFAIVAVILLGGFLAALYNYFPRVFHDFFSLTRSFSLRESDENLLKSRPLSRINLLFYLYLSFLIALVLMLLINHLDLHFEAAIFYPDGFWEGLWKWLQLSAIIACWFFAKYLLIQNVSVLFFLRNFTVSHYFNYIRMTLLIFTIGLITILCSYYAFEVISPAYYKTLYNILLFCMGLRILILFFKLLSTAPYKSLHLFSYLCGTEVIPFVILLYLGINQPF